MLKPIKKQLPARILFLAAILCTLFCNHLVAQQSILLNQTIYDISIINPAALGLNDYLTTTCHYKKNWLGLSESPEHTQVSVNGAIRGSNAALGLNLGNEKSGLLSKTSLKGSFRYKAKISEKQFLLFGLSAGFQRQICDFSKIRADEPGEFTGITQLQSSTVPDASFGMAYVFGNLFVGFSANQILGQHFSYSDPIAGNAFGFKVIPQYVLAVRHIFSLQPETWSYSPSIILRSSQGLPLQLDVLNSFEFRNKVIIGLGYRNYYAFYLNLGFEVSQKFKIMYSYEYSSSIHALVSGGHELGITFGLSNNNNISSSNGSKHKSQELKKLYEELDKQDQQIEMLYKKVDSLDKNVPIIQNELSNIKNKQIQLDEIYGSFDSNKSGGMERKTTSETFDPQSFEQKPSGSPKYKILNPRSEQEYDAGSETQSANYKIVFGVYQNIENAKEYQKFLKREMSLDTKLIQLSGHSKNFIYVCSVIEHNNMKAALSSLKTVRKEISASGMQVTYGEAWILQTLNQ